MQWDVKLRRILLGGLALAGPGLTTGTAQGGQQGPRPPLLRVPDPVSPEQAFRLVQRGNRAYVENRGEVPTPPEPHLAGRYLAAVLHSPELPAPAARLLHARHRDIYALSSPGPQLRRQEVAALERLNRQHRLSLCVILVRDDDPYLDPGEAVPAGMRAARARHLAACRKLCKEARIPLAAAHGMLQAELLWQSSEHLDRQRLRRRFQVAVGRVMPRSGAIEWLTHWHEFSGLVGPGHAREQALTDEARSLQEELADRRRQHARVTAQLRVLDEDQQAAAETLVRRCLQELLSRAQTEDQHARAQMLEGLIEVVDTRAYVDHEPTRRYLHAIAQARKLVVARLAAAEAALHDSERRAGLRPAQPQPARPGSAPAPARGRGH